MSAVSGRKANGLGCRKATGLGAFINYLTAYFKNISVRVFLLTAFFIAGLTTLNYTVGIETRIRDLRPWPLSLLGFFLFYGFVFFVAWGMQYPFGKRGAFKKGFLVLLLLAPLFFSIKMIHWDLSSLLPAGWQYPWNYYALIVLQWPAKLLLLLSMLYACAKTGLFRETGAGWRGGIVRPYFLILLLLVPLVVLASTQHDFLRVYPKVKNIAFINGYTHPVWPWNLLYELSYGLDFVSIELFFRGFLVIGLVRWCGPDAILPMAAFYCTIHFGKPLGECISSFFGGLALGVIAWRTRSILGGLIVHLGLAWLMEIGGYLGRLYV